MTSLADFDINADGDDQGYDATNAEVLTIRLRNSIFGVRSWVLQTFDSTAFDRTKSIERNPPRQSKGAPELTLVGATSGKAVSPSTVGGNITTTMPGSGSHSWLLRSIVNGGIGTDGKADASLIRERMVVIRDADDSRKIVSTERTQYEDDGWAGASMVGPVGPTGAAGGTGPTGGIGPTGPAGTFSPATGTATGRASYNAYTSADSPITWTTAADIPAGSLLVIHLSGPGGGGGGGGANRTSAGADVLGGGAGGGGVRLPPILMSRQAVIDGLPVVITLPAGGSAGAGGSTAGAQVGGSDGSSPSGDATISFAGVVVFTAFRGGGGSGAAAGGASSEGAGGGGGGLYQAGTAATTIGTIGGRPTPGASSGTEANGSATSPGFGGGFGAQASSSGSVGGSSVYGGGGGGCSLIGAGAGGTGGRSGWGGSGGGGGGSVDAATTARAGKNAGANFTRPGATGGAVGAVGNPGIAGTEGMGASGGGGGGSVMGASATGMVGGVGGVGGGGGGGGGAAMGTSGTATGGTGGIGGSAQCIVVGLPG